jgi:hypothetical protein
MGMARRLHLGDGAEVTWENMRKETGSLAWLPGPFIAAELADCALERSTALSFRAVG